MSVIDVDLQDPPELICDIVDCWRNGADVIYAVRSVRRGESWFKKTSVALFYRALRTLTAVGLKRAYVYYKRAIATSMVWNYALCRRWDFRD